MTPPPRISTSLPFGVCALNVSFSRHLRDVTRAAHDLPRLRAGVLAVLQHLHAVDEHVAHAGRVLLRMVERRVVDDRRRIEDHDVGDSRRP